MYVLQGTGTFNANSLGAISEAARLAQALGGEAAAVAGVATT